MPRATFVSRNAAIVRRMSGRYWRDYLDGKTSVQIEDVRQDAWLALLEHPEAVDGLRPKRILWDLRGTYEFRGAPKRWQWRGEGLGTQHAGAQWDFHVLRLSSLGPQELDYLYQNLWAVGTPETVEALVRKMEGARGRNAPDRNTFIRALPRILRAFPTREALLGPSRARWMHPSCRGALAVYAGLRVPKGLKARTLAQPSADARAFYDRQLALGWGKRAEP